MWIEYVFGTYESSSLTSIALSSVNVFQTENEKNGPNHSHTLEINDDNVVSPWGTHKCHILEDTIGYGFARQNPCFGYKLAPFIGVVVN